MKKFALIGAAGYVAKKHLEAIKAVEGELVAALDPNDNVGILDRYFPDADFFTEFERFDRHLEKLKRQNQPIDYLVICSPNYLHDAHCRFGLRLGADVICEKPLAIRPYNVEALMEMERESGRRIHNILQLRLHPQLVALKDFIEKSPADRRFDIELTYITARGKWYFASWKGELAKSGGIAVNIGIHFFDVLQWIFGSPVKNELHLREFDREAGLLEFERARVRWFLSIQKETLPAEVQAAGRTTFRSLTIDGREWEFSDGFTELHSESYRRILAGDGFSSGDALGAVRLTFDLRGQVAVFSPNRHPFADLPLAKHPFSV